MWIAILLLLLFGAQFSFTAFAPADNGKAWFLWPFAADSRPWLGFIGGLPQQGGSSIVPIIAGIAGLCFLGAVLGLLGWFVPPTWWRPLVIVASFASLILFVVYFSPWAIAPIVVDLILLWGVFGQNWSVGLLRGA